LIFPQASSSEIMTQPSFRAIHCAIVVLPTPAGPAIKITLPVICLPPCVTLEHAARAAERTCTRFVPLFHSGGVPAGISFALQWNCRCIVEHSASKHTQSERRDND